MRRYAGRFRPFFSAHRAVPVGMKSTDLTPDQAHAIHRKLDPMVAYLTLLEERMEQRDFPRDDKLYRLTKRAYAALHELFLETHELSTIGTGRRAK